MRYYDKEHLKGTIYDSESLAYRIAHTPKSDFTELDKEVAIFLKELKEERKKEIEIIREARKQGEI